MRYTYPALLTPNELGGYSVQFVDFPEGYTDGDTIDDAVDMAAEVLELLVVDYVERRRIALPKPTWNARVAPGSLLAAVSVDANVDTMLVSSRQAASMLGVSNARVRQMILSGQLASKKRGRDNYVYVWSINARKAAAPKAGRPRSTA